MVNPTGPSRNSDSYTGMSTNANSNTDMDAKVNGISQDKIKASFHSPDLTFGAKLLKFESWIVDKLNIFWESLFSTPQEAKENGVSTYKGVRYYNVSTEEDPKSKHTHRLFQTFLKGDEAYTQLIEKDFKTNINNFAEFQFNGEESANVNDELSDIQKYNVVSLLNDKLMKDFHESLEANLIESGALMIHLKKMAKSMTVHINEKEDGTIHLTARFPVNIVSWSRESLGFIAAERKFILSKEDFNTDWKNKLGEVAPSLLVVDTVSRFATTPEAAMRHLKLLTTTEPIVKKPPENKPPHIFIRF